MMHSFGGPVSASFAKGVLGIKKAVLVGSGGYNMPPDASFPLLANKQVKHELFHKSVPLFKDASMYDTWYPYAIKNREQCRIPINIQKKLNRHSAQYFLPNLLPDFKCESMYFLWGDSDVCCYPSLKEQQKMLLEAKPASKSKIIKDAGHMVMWEKPIEFNRTIIEWLKD